MASPDNCRAWRARWRAPLALLAAFMPAAAAHAASLEAYGHLPRLENVALSPDGARLAFVKTEENSRVVAVITVANHEMLGGTRLGSEKVRFIKWADSDHLMIVSSVTAVPVGFIGDPSEWFQMQVYDVASHRSLSVPDTDRNTADVVNDFEVLNIFYGRVMVRHLQGHTMLFVPGLQKTTAHVSPALIRVDLQTHDSRIVRIGRTWQQHWLVDAAGELAAEQTYDPEPRRWRVAIRREGRMQEVATGQEMIELPRLLGFGPSADSILMAMPEADGGAQWHLLSLTDGKLGEPLVDTGDLDEPIEDPATQQMIGGVKFADTAQYVFFDPQLQSRWDSILRVFPEQRVHFESASADHRKFVVRVDGARGFKYELVDLDSHRADLLGEVYDHIPLPYEIRRIDYPAADGTLIPAYLTLPRGKPAKKLSLIVMPHGGPAVRQTADFDWWSQALADQGYAVLQPNYRGSDLGWKFMSAGFGQWGRKMQTDLSDGVRYLAREEIADPAKVCIVGASYGGYAALAGVTLACTLLPGLAALRRPYGMLVCVKALLFAALLALAALNRQRLTPALARGEAWALPVLRRSLSAEYLLLGTALIATAALTGFFSPAD